MKKILLFSFLLFLFHNYYSQTKYTISGYVKEKGSKELLLGVPVYIPNLKVGTVTNTYGFYSLTLSAQDTITLLYSFVGFQPVTKKIQLDKNIQLDIELASSSYLQEVEVVEYKADKVSQSSQMSTIDIPIEQIKDIPALLGEKDVLKVLQLMPGVQKGSEGNSGIYVRGGGPDQNLIILDDAIVYNAYHLFGFFSLFNGDALKSIELTKGGFPARYGGRLSSVIEMNMKDGNKEKFKVEGGIGLISSRLTIEGPILKDKCSFLISARRTYVDVLARPFMNKEEGIGGYYFYDLNAKINYDINYKNKIYLSGYFGKDKAYYNEGEDDSQNFSLGWGNTTATARWNHLFNSKLFSNTSFIYSNYKFQILDNQNYDGNKFSLDFRSGIQDLTLKYDLDFHPTPKHYIRGGLISTYHRFTPQALEVKDNSFTENNLSHIEHIDTYESAAYIEDDFKITPQLRVNGGLRFSYFLNEDKNYLNLQPRISTSYNLKEDLAIKASYATMSQNLHLLSTTGVGLPTDLWLPATNRVAPQQSQQVALGIAKDFNKQNFAITIEGYYKKMGNILAYKEGASFLDVQQTSNSSLLQETWQDKVTSGQGWSYGAEFLLQRKFGKLSGWIGYTLSWTQLQFDELNFGNKFYARYDRRHDFSIVAIYKAREESEHKQGITLSATWVYGTGNAITLPVAGYSAPVHSPSGKFIYDGNYVSEYTERNGYRMAAYHRFDIGIQFTKHLKRIERTWELSIYNVYNRQNPFFYYIGTEEDTGKNVLKQISLFPIIPSVSYNFKF